MPDILVSSLEYGELFQKLLSRRILLAGETFVTEGHALLVKRTEAAAGAISECIMKDLKPLELARLTSLLPVSLRERRMILPRAIMLTEESGLRFAPSRREYVLSAVRSHLAEEDLLIAEGFLRFRLPLLFEDWALAVDRAGEGLFIPF